MWLNRKEVPLPDVESIIFIKHKYNEVYLCKWYPFDPNNYYPDTVPAEGYIGTARVITGQNIGFNVWNQNESEFIYYQILNYPDGN